MLEGSDGSTSTRRCRLNRATSSPAEYTLPGNSEGRITDSDISFVNAWDRSKPIPEYVDGIDSQSRVRAACTHMLRRLMRPGRKQSLVATLFHKSCLALNTSLPCAAFRNCDFLCHRGNPSNISTSCPATLSGHQRLGPALLWSH